MCFAQVHNPVTPVRLEPLLVGNSGLVWIRTKISCTGPTGPFYIWSYEVQYLAGGKLVDV